MCPNLSKACIKYHLPILFISLTFFTHPSTQSITYTNIASQQKNSYSRLQMSVLYLETAAWNCSRSCSATRCSASSDRSSPSRFSIRCCRANRSASQSCCALHQTSHLSYAVTQIQVKKYKFIRKKCVTYTRRVQLASMNVNNDFHYTEESFMNDVRQ